ncbi:hypothetical protein EV195_10460 [Tenacibaculum skagerrakense]|uniref:Uncharacterized protein n=1 Tax=Tenacibaculum skagerrakense TaxID=186571 RepID=A0A4R2NSS9_9FLAO|nr:hypothetical protein [Tenacibaculum skagerrakense]TCP25029.1 hypothetical protein EV195_10460 [Tenacibaculum skagerrakense]
MKTLLRKLCKLFGVNTIDTPDTTKPKTLLTYKEIVTMLHEYDRTRFELLVNGLGFEDTRINTFDFYELKNYMNYMEKEAKEKGIKLKGISFIKGVYSEENAPKDEFINYENLLYTPTAIVNGEEVEIDVLNSTKDNIVTLRSKLKEYNYEWRYDNKENFKLKSSKKEEVKTSFKAIMMRDGFTEEESGLGNKTHLSPPN